MINYSVKTLVSLDFPGGGVDFSIDFENKNFIQEYLPREASSF